MTKILTVIFVFALILFSCVPPVDEDFCGITVSPVNNPLVFRLVNESGDLLLGGFDSKYSNDDLSVTDFSDNVVRQFEIIGPYITFLLVDQFEVVLDSMLTKEYKLGIEISRGNIDYDTLKFEFNYKELECPPIEFDQLAAYYNNKLVYEGDFEVIDITKPD